MVCAMQVLQPTGGDASLANEHEDLPINGNGFGTLYKKLELFQFFLDYVIPNPVRC